MALKQIPVEHLSEVDTFQIIDFDMIQHVPCCNDMIETILKHAL